MRGDRVEIVVDTGDGSRSFAVTATRAGRRVEITTSRQVIEVTELTRTGVPVRTARFLAARVIALVEHPAGDAPVVDPTAAEPPTGGPRPAPEW